LPWLPGCLEWEPDRTRRTLHVISAFVIVFATQPFWVRKGEVETISFAHFRHSLLLFYAFDGCYTRIPFFAFRNQNKRLSRIDEREIIFFLYFVICSL
jgi:hypothetical protein